MRALTNILTFMRAGTYADLLAMTPSDLLAVTDTLQEQADRRQQNV